MLPNFVPGSLPMTHAWITLIGCAGLMASSARIALQPQQEGKQQVAIAAMIAASKCR